MTDCKSQNTKNEQQNNLCIASEMLTGQCKKGELTGEYWCKITESPYPERVYLPACDSDIIVKVLAPVPSYDGYMTLIRAYNDVAEENSKLKELLKECYTAMGETQYWDMCKLLPKINKVLGEDK